MQFRHRMVEGVSRADEDRSKGLFRPKNFLTTKVPALWTPKFELLGRNLRFRVR